MAHAKQLFPQVREFFFDDDTFTDDRPARRGDRARPRQARHHLVVQRQGQRALRDAEGADATNGLRLLLVGFESGNQEILNNIRKGTRVDRAREFAEDCRRLGILIHGTFILGLPGETRETIERTIAFAKEVDPYSLQVSLAAPYPGTELYRQATEEGWLRAPDAGARGPRRVPRLPGGGALLRRPAARGDARGRSSASTGSSTSARARSCASCATCCATAR